MRFFDGQVVLESVKPYLQRKWILLVYLFWIVRNKIWFVISFILSLLLLNLPLVLINCSLPATCRLVCSYLKPCSFALPFCTLLTSRVAMAVISDNKIDEEIILVDIRSSALFIKASGGCKKSDLASVGDSTAQLRLSAVSFCIFKFCPLGLMFSC